MHLDTVSRGVVKLVLLQADKERVRDRFLLRRKYLPYIDYISLEHRVLMPQLVTFVPWSHVVYSIGAALQKYCCGFVLRTAMIPLAPSGRATARHVRRLPLLVEAQ